MTEFISLGENCLPDDILSHLHLKKESYPFGGGRFNIEYITRVVETDFHDLLNAEYLHKGMTEAKEVVRNSLYTNSHNIYSETVTLGFEFTHHNVLEEVPRRSFIRKIERFKNALTSGRKIVFFYHYRYSDKMNVEVVKKLIEEFLSMLKKKSGHQHKCLLVYQTLSSEKKRIVITPSSNLCVAEFITPLEWEGDDLWNGSTDRDLFEELFRSKTLRSFAYGSLYFLEPLKVLGRKISGKIFK